MTASERIRLARMGREYLELCNEGERLGVPTSLDDPRSPRTVAGLREKVYRASVVADARAFFAGRTDPYGRAIKVALESMDPDEPEDQEYAAHVLRVWSR